MDCTHRTSRASRRPADDIRIISRIHPYGNDPRDEDIPSYGVVIPLKAEPRFELSPFRDSEVEEVEVVLYDRGYYHHAVFWRWGFDAGLRTADHVKDGDDEGRNNPPLEILLCISVHVLSLRRWR